MQRRPILIILGVALLLLAVLVITRPPAEPEPQPTPSPVEPEIRPTPPPAVTYAPRDREGAAALPGSKIILLANHENPKNDFYSLDGDGGNFRRVTNIDLFKDNPSLCKDRSRLAFTGSSREDDYAGYEIYTVKMDGTDLKKVTNNQFMDAHPGWSPDCRQIVFAAYHAGDSSTEIYLVNADGTNLRKVTNDTYEDNDPDFMPNGQQIVFKSNRWSGKEQIGIMDINGQNIRRLTTNSKSDHDPIASHDGQWIIFERYDGPGNWDNWDVSLANPWGIYAVKADGSQERTLSADGKMNWLPVYSPDNQYILFLKTIPTGTRLYRAKADGSEATDLNITFRVGYLDWR